MSLNHEEQTMYLKIYIYILILNILVGCSTSPEILDRPPPPDNKIISIAKLQDIRGTRAKQIDSDVIIKGRVVSSDLYINIRKELYIQDATGGVVVSIDDPMLFATYAKGCEVTVHCNSLYISPFGTTTRLGYQYSIFDVAPIPMDKAVSYITITDTKLEWSSTLTTIASLDQRLLGRLIEIPDVQFVEDEVGLAWTDYGIPTIRHLTDRSGNILEVFTLPQALFANRALPRGSGSVQGLLTVEQKEYRILIIELLDAVLDMPRF